MKTNMKNRVGLTLLALGYPIFVWYVATDSDTRKAPEERVSPAAG